MMKMSLRLEIHDSKCIRCHDPKPSGGKCYSCGFEEARVHALRGESAFRAIDEHEKARDKRRRENEK